MGAWIETKVYVSSEDEPKSRPSWARGLKLGFTWSRICIYPSRPSWARGLKQHHTFVLNNLTSRALHGRVD